MPTMNQLWYKPHSLSCFLLLPVAWIYNTLSSLRRSYLKQFKQTRFSVPIIVVGNLTLGGVGKTPLVIALAKAFQNKGIRVGVVSRGYGARTHFPRQVCDDDKPDEVGDEPLLIYKKTGCPVVISPRRVEAVQYLLKHHSPQIILSDDGLQHYAMGRAIEIAVIDGARGLGNGLLFPAGPLREKKSRLKEVDFIIANSGEWSGAHQMKMSPGEMTNLLDKRIVKYTDLVQPVAAVAAIGNPKRFYKTLDDLQISYQPYSFPDHYRFRPNDLVLKEKTIVMTEKDAVKCLTFATDNMVVLPVTAELEQTFWDALWKHPQLKEVLSA